jgi:hypothetical protein
MSGFVRQNKSKRHQMAHNLINFHPESRNNHPYANARWGVLPQRGPGATLMCGE